MALNVTWAMLSSCYKTQGVVPCQLQRLGIVS